MEDDNVLGFLCDNRLITIIDEEETVLILSKSKNKVIDAEPIVYVYSKYKKISQECRLVVINAQQLYYNRFYPRTYYTIYRVVIQQPKIKLYLMEKFNGSTGYISFYPCKNYSECREIIRKEEDLD